MGEWTVDGPFVRCKACGAIARSTNYLNHGEGCPEAGLREMDGKPVVDARRFEIAKEIYINWCKKSPILAQSNHQKWIRLAWDLADAFLAAEVGTATVSYPAVSVPPLVYQAPDGKWHVSVRGQGATRLEAVEDLSRQFEEFITAKSKAE